VQFSGSSRGIRRTPSTLRRLTWVLSLSLVILGSLMALSSRADAQYVGTGPETGKTLPRFVSLGEDKAFLRRGPTMQHAIEWVYLRRDLPIQVVAEHDNWRKVRDFDGTIGWMNRVVLSNERTGMVLLDGTTLHRLPTPDSAVVALMGDGLVGKVDRCIDGWCEMRFPEISGWLPQSALYGVGRDEEFR
jgi:SH3-like domain-containing protein